MRSEIVFAASVRYPIDIGFAAGTRRRRESSTSAQPVLKTLQTLLLRCIAKAYAAALEKEPL